MKLPYMLDDCTGLKSLVIEESDSTLDPGNPFYNRSLKTVFVGRNGDWYYNEYHSKVFNVDSLENISFGNGVTYIPENLCYLCRKITSVTIPNSVTEIGRSAFMRCSGLTSVNIPKTVRVIKDEAFSGCSGLTSVNIPDSVTEISDSVFYGCSGLTSVNIPNTVTEIGNHAFYGCSGLTSVNIPNTVTEIGNSAFYGCSGLTSVNIPNTVTEIGNSAFYGCYRLTSVNIPNSVKEIGWDAFRECGLTNITIPNSVREISLNTFHWCSDLTSVTIPNSVRKIGEQAFMGCPNLMNIYCLAERPPVLKNNSFDNTLYLTDVTLYVPAGSVAAYQADEIWNNFFWTIKELNPTGVNDIKQEADEPEVTIGDGHITVNHSAGDIAVYNASGILVKTVTATEESTRIELPEGHVYIIKAGGKSMMIRL